MTKEKYPGWLPIQVAKHYGFPLELTGKGQTAAIISLGGEIDMNELKNDFQAMRISMPDIKVVDLEGITKKQNKGDSGETHLDVEVIGSICPDAKITIYRGPNPNGFADTVQKAIDDGNSVISISWGGSEVDGDQYSQMETVLETAKKQQITVCVSAGDGGSSNSRDPNTGQTIAAPDCEAHVDYPASSPNVLACGGTEMMMESGTYFETVWNNSAQGGGASGGGVSEVFKLPSWQKDAGISIANANTGNSGRVVPDVCGLAAGGDWKIYQSGQEEGIGGTSAVAPLWASLITLINEKRASLGKKKLGFINEHLYELAQKDGLFTDITQGNNKITCDYPGYRATKGFDACTGWGTPVGKALFDALVGLD